MTGLLACLFLAACSHHADRCVKKGCLGEQCVLLSQKAAPSGRCDWKPSDGCQQTYGKCEMQANGECGFSMNHALASCLKDPGGYGFQ